MRQFPALPAGLPTSTIGSIRLNFRVRNGNGWIPYDIVTAMAECIADTFTTEEEKEEIELKTNEWGKKKCERERQRFISSSRFQSDFRFFLSVFCDQALDLLVSVS